MLNFVFLKFQIRKVKLIYKTIILTSEGARETASAQDTGPVHHSVKQGGRSVLVDVRDYFRGHRRNDEDVPVGTVILGGRRSQVPSESRVVPEDFRALGDLGGVVPRVGFQRRHVRRDVAHRPVPEPAHDRSVRVVAGDDERLRFGREFGPLERGRFVFSAGYTEFSAELCGGEFAAFFETGRGQLELLLGVGNVIVRVEGEGTAGGKIHSCCCCCCCSRNLVVFVVMLLLL